MVYTYSLPMVNDVAMILSRRVIPTRILDVFVDHNELVASSNLQFQGEVAFAAHPFFHYRGSNLAPDARPWIQVTRLTGTTPMLRVGGYGLILAIALFGIAFPIYGSWYRNRRQRHAEPMSTAQLQQWQTERARLLQTLARLDDQRAAGNLDEATYQQSRNASKRQLLDIVEQLYEAQQAKV